MKRFFLPYSLIAMTTLITGVVAIILSTHVALSPPQLKLVSDTITLSKIHRGEIATTTIKLVNTGDQALKILSIRPSCGCTVVQLPDSVIPPKSSRSTFKVAFNSSNKPLGIITKSIKISTNANTENLIVKCEVLNDSGVHMKIMSLETIFFGSCRNCHVDQGIGKQFKALYHADCAICHNSPNCNDLNAYRLDRPGIKLSSAEILKIITFGKADKGMPAFSKAYGGPLDSAQIASLISYFKDFN
jgi:hypothetical protein